MNITAAHLTQSTNPTGGTNIFTTPSVSPSPNKLQLLTIAAQDTSVTPAQPTISGCNLTWELAATKQNSFDGKQKIWVFRALAPNPTPGTITITFSGSITSVLYSLDEFTPVNKSLGEGEGAIVQTTTGDSNSTDGTIAMTLSAFQNSSNATFFAIISPDLTSIPAGFSDLIGIVQDLGPDNTLRVGFKDSPATSFNLTWAGSGAEVSSAIALEIKLAKPSSGFLLAS